MYAKGEIGTLCLSVTKLRMVNSKRKREASPFLLPWYRLLCSSRAL